MWDFFLGKRSLEDVHVNEAQNRDTPRRVRRRMIFQGTENATLKGFEAMWKIPAESDLNLDGGLFADDAFIRQEYVEIYDLIRENFDGKLKGTALIRGSSGTGKSAFLEYLVARIRNEENDVLVVRGSSYDAKKKNFLHLSTGWFGRKTATRITEHEAVGVEEKCTWTIVDGCDWEPIANFTVGAASPSTPWKGFRKVSNLIQIVCRRGLSAS